jgi:hypothetical protein
MRAVMLGVMAAGLDMMMFGMAGVPVRAVRVMGCLFVVTGFVMLGGFAMMFRGVLVVLGSLVMMLDARMVAHVCSPGSAMKRDAGLRKSSDNLLTALRQDCCG